MERGVTPSSRDTSRVVSTSSSSWEALVMSATMTSEYRHVKGPTRTLPDCRGLSYRDGVTTDQLIGRRVHMELWDRGIQQRDLCEALGISEPSLSRKLRGLRPWTVDEVLQASDFFRIPVTELLPRVDSNHQPAGYGSARIIALRPVTRATVELVG